MISKFLLQRSPSRRVILILQHARVTDGHLGNLLIRPAPQMSRSPYNFEIALLDHGLYFDLDTRLRINYSKLWLSLIATSSPSVNADRRMYAQLVGNIGPDLVGCFIAESSRKSNNFCALSILFSRQPSLVSLSFFHLMP